MGSFLQELEKEVKQIQLESLLNYAKRNKDIKFNKEVDKKEKDQCDGKKTLNRNRCPYRIVGFGKCGYHLRVAKLTFYKPGKTSRINQRHHGVR
jgi:hypothetical protein